MKNIALVYGFGKSGVAASKLLAEIGFSVSGFDDDINKEMPSFVEDRRGKFLDEILHGISLLVLSPDVPLSCELATYAENNNIEIIGETELGARYCVSEIIAVTGTNGKTTTTLLIKELLRSCKLSAHALGNIGTPLSEVARTLTKDEIVVLEVSSAQLETIDMLKPKIAVVLNLTPDHLERHGSFAEYVRCKEEILKNSDSNDYAVLNADDEVVEFFAQNTPVKDFYFSIKQKVKGCYLYEDNIYFSKDGDSEEKICGVAELNLRGMHNVQNALAALCVCKILGFLSEVLVGAIQKFVLPKHRIELIAKIGKTQFFDDSKGTNIQATISACESMVGSTALIVGGYDKGFDYAEFFYKLPPSVHGVFCVGGNKKNIVAQTNSAWRDVVVECADLQDALARAYDTDVLNVLYSPTTSSFDEYTDYKQRGEVFAGIVKRFLDAKN